MVSFCHENQANIIAAFNSTSRYEHFFLLLFYSTVAVLCRVAAIKVSQYIIKVQVIFYFLWSL